MTKRTERSERLKKNIPIKRRTDKLFWKIFVKASSALRRLKNA